MAHRHRSSSSYQSPGPPQELYDPRDYNPQDYNPQDYDQQDYDQQDYDQQDYDQQDYDPQDYDPQDYDPQDYNPQDYNPQDYNPQAGDLSLQHQRTYYPEMNSTSIPRYTGEPRHVVLQGQPPAVVASHIRGSAAPAPQYDQDFFQSNYPLSHFAEIASQQPRLPTGDSMHQEYQQGQPAWQAAPPAGSQPHQQIRTTRQRESLPGSQNRPHHHDIPRSRVPPGSSSVRPPAEPVGGGSTINGWPQNMNEYLLQQGAKVVDRDQPYGPKYKWNNLADDFKRTFPDAAKAPSTLENNFYILRKEAREKEQEAREKEQESREKENS